MKKYAGPIAGAGILVIAAISYFMFTPVNIFKAVPKTAIAIVEASDWNKLNQQLSTTPAGTALKNTVLIKKLTGEMEDMQQLLAGNKILQSKVISPKIITSVHLTSANDFDFLFATPVSGVDDNMVVQQIKTSKNVRSINIREFKKQKVIDIGLADGKQITFADLKGFFVFSFTSFLTESSITGLTSGNNVESDKEFKVVRKKFLPTGDLRIFFNFHESRIILPVFMKQQFIPLLRDVSNFAGWGAYNISLVNDVIKIDGTAHTPSKNLEARTINTETDTVLSNIPDNAAYFNLSAFEPASDKFFKDWAGSSHAFVTLEPLKEDFDDENLFIISLNNKQKALISIKKLMAGTGSENAVDSFGKTEIYNLKAGAIINQTFGGSMTGFKNSYFALTDKVAIFGNAIDAVKLTLDKIAKGETVPKANVSNATNLVVNSSVYLNPERAVLMIKDLVQPGSSVANFLGQFDVTLLQTTYSDAWLNTSASFKINKGTKTSGGLLWKTSLKAPAGMAPQIVLNSNTGEKEIFIQDTLGNLYLIDKSGEIQFTTSIEEKVIGNVYQLDYYDNGKLQYIFNTATHVYIMDRLGNFVASYPIRLSRAASTGLTVTKDSNSGAYRYYVPALNGAVYGYESTGKPLAGWSPRTGAGTISRPLQSIWMDNRFYLLGNNEQGKLTLYNDHGDVQWRVENLPSVNQDFSVIRRGGGLFFLNASAKQLITISQAGNDDLSPLVDSATYFTATPVSDTSYLYFFSNRRQVRSYNQHNKFQKSLSLKGAAISSLSVLDIGGAKVLIVADSESQKIFVYDLELNPVAEYPVADIHLFSITNLFDNGELTGIQSEKGPMISSYRLK